MEITGTRRSSFLFHLEVLQDTTASIFPARRSTSSVKVAWPRAIDHPHSVEIYQAGEEANLLYLAMGYVDGPDLLTVLCSEGRFALG